MLTFAPDSILFVFVLKIVISTQVMARSCDHNDFLKDDFGLKKSIGGSELEGNMRITAL